MAPSFSTLESSEAVQTVARAANLSSPMSKFGGAFSVRARQLLPLGIVLHRKCTFDDNARDYLTGLGLPPSLEDRVGGTLEMKLDD